MARKDSLFRLIKSMDKAEKGYFKKFASMYSGSRSQNYIRLFDFIDKQKTYDEQEIRKKFKGEKFLNNLSAAKNYLFENILRSLKSYQAPATPQQQINSLLTNARIMFKKGLFKERLSSLKKAKELANHTEEFALLMEIISEEILSEIQDIKKGDIHQINRLLDERKAVLGKQGNFDDLRLLYFKLFELRVNSTDLKKVDLKIAESIVRSPLLQDESHALSLKAKAMYFLIWQYYHEFREEAEQAYLLAKRYLQMLRDNPSFTKRRDAQNQIFGLYNFLNKSREAKRFDEYPDLIRELKEIKPEYLALKVFQFECIAEASLLYVIHARRFDLVDTYLPEILEGHQTYSTNIRPYALQSNYHYFSIIYLNTGNYELALEWNLKAIDQLKGSGARADFGLSSRLLNLLIHFELGNTYFISNMTRSLDRLIRQNPIPLPLEKIVLKYMDKLSVAPDLKTVKRELLELFTAIEQTMPETKVFDRTLYHFDIKSWVKSKLSNCTMAELFRAEAAIRIQEDEESI